MSNRTETTEYNLLYEDDNEFEFDPWEPELAEVEYFLNSLKENPTQQEAVEQAVIVQRTRVTFTTDWERMAEPIVEPESEAGMAPKPLFEIRDTKNLVPPIRNLRPHRDREAAEKHAAQLNRSYHHGQTHFEIFEIEDIGQPTTPANRVLK